MVRNSRLLAFFVGTALGLAQGALAFGYQVAVTGSVIGYFITFVTWCLGSAIALVRPRALKPAWLPVPGILGGAVLGTLAMLTLEGSWAAGVVGACFTALAGYLAGTLLAQCDRWGLAPDLLMVWENAGFVSAFALATVALLFLGAWAVGLLVVQIACGLAWWWPRAGDSGGQSDVGPV